MPKIDILKEVVTKWSFRGRKLNNPATITRRLLCWPPMIVCLALTAFFVLLGWGVYDAKRFWRDAW